MFTSDFYFNMKDALRKSDLPQYGGVCRIINEPVEQWLKLTPVKNPRVLTIATDGNQALTYAANGATYVNTFDLTINSCAVMDFKTTALQTLSYSEYKNVVDKLYDPRKIGAMDRIGFRSEYKQFFQTIKNMPARTHKLMDNIIRNKICVFDQSSHNSIPFPKDEKTYEQMQSACKQPFDFIWCDIKNLPYYIDGTYDIINISNIFDYCLCRGDTEIDIYETAMNLVSFLNPGGYMLCTSFIGYQQRVIDILRKMKDKKTTIKIPKQKPDFGKLEPVVIRKTR